MHRVQLFLSALLLLICGTARADFVTVNEGGYGPFTCARDGGGALPSWGYSENYSGVNYTGTCERWRGDISLGSSHPGGGSWFGIAVRSVQVSPQGGTMAWLCQTSFVENNPAPCIGRTWEAWGTSPAPAMPFIPDSTVIGYSAPCPLMPGMDSIYMCSGDYTPYDGSGLATAVISDGIPKPGLPHGSPLKLVVPGAVGVGAECLATLSNYPAVPTLGYTQVMAVYDCP